MNLRYGAVTLGVFLLFVVIFASKTSGEIAQLEITIKDHKFVPNVVSAPSDTKIKLIIHNNDATPEEFETYSPKRERMIPGNSSASVVFAPLKEGRYEFFGEFHEDTARGVLVVIDKEKYYSK